LFAEAVDQFQAQGVLVPEIETRQDANTVVFIPTKDPSCLTRGQRDLHDPIPARWKGIFEGVG